MLFDKQEIRCNIYNAGEQNHWKEISISAPMLCRRQKAFRAEQQHIRLQIGQNVLLSPLSSTPWKQTMCDACSIPGCIPWTHLLLVPSPQHLSLWPRPTPEGLHQQHPDFWQQDTTLPNTHDLPDSPNMYHQRGNIHRHHNSKLRPCMLSTVSLPT